MTGEPLYAVFEVTPNGVRIAGLFPPSDAGCERALNWGDETYDEFHAAEPMEHRAGEAFLKKCHGVHIDRENTGD